MDDLMLQIIDSIPKDTKKRVLLFLHLARYLLKPFIADFRIYPNPVSAGSKGTCLLQGAN